MYVHFGCNFSLCCVLQQVVCIYVLTFAVCSNKCYLLLPVFHILTILLPFILAAHLYILALSLLMFYDSVFSFSAEKYKQRLAVFRWKWKIYFTMKYQEQHVSLILYAWSNTKWQHMEEIVYDIFKLHRRIQRISIWIYSNGWMLYDRNSNFRYSRLADYYDDQNESVQGH